MHSLLTFRLVGLAGLLVVAAVGACSNGGDEGLLITKNVAVMEIVGGCTFTGDPNEQFLAAGTVDPLSEEYLLNPQIESRITADSSDPTSMSQRTVILTDADVDIAFADSTLFSSTQLATMKSTGLTHFKQLVSAPITPLGTSDAELNVMPKDLITMVAAASTDPVEMEVTVTVHGTMSGEDVDSQAFTYPVTEASVIQPNVVACPLPMTTTVELGDPCNIFQDEPLTCCTNADGSLACPATVASS